MTEELESGVALHDEDDEGFDDKYPGERRKWEEFKQALSNNKRKIIIFLVVIVILLLVAIAICAAVLIPVLILTTGGGDDQGSSNHHNNNETNTPYYGDEGYFNTTKADVAIDCCLDDFPYHNLIWNTIEYQVGLDATKFKDRQKETDVYLAKFDELSGLNLSYNNGNQSTRDEYDLKVSNCASSMEIRVRDYLSGPKAGYTTVDSKYNSKSLNDVLNSPLYPSNAQAPTAYQKAEQDQHECSSKYARETRCTLESPVKFSTCQDVLDLYPGIFPSLSSINYSKSVSAGGTAHWWVLEHTVYNFTTIINNEPVYSKMDSTFTLKYDSAAAAKSGSSAPTYGEWSFRLYAQSAGPSVAWIPQITSQCMNIYKSMVSTFEGTQC